jgi:guanyl-specific ribonuclease Sa
MLGGMGSGRFGGKALSSGSGGGLRARTFVSGGAGPGGGAGGGVGGAVARIAPGSLPAAEEQAVLGTLKHIDAGTKPSGPLGKKWGTHFNNKDGDLPGGRFQNSPYQEYRVAPPPGTSGAGPLRVVGNPQTGDMFYTWTHYGDTGTPAFVQIR